MDANITVLKDESLGGVQREYREVKRKARVGERIKVTAGRSAMLGEDFEGRVFSVISTDNYHADTDGKWADGSTLNPSDDDYVVLEPTDIIRVNGERLRMADRKAALGERVIIVNWLSNKHVDRSAYKNGDIATITSVRTFVKIPHNDYLGYVALNRSEYRVLEPVESAPLSAQPPLDQAAATIGALQAQIQALESRVSTLEQAQATAAKVDDAPRAKSAQEIRDEIVEHAKADVKALLDRNYYGGYNPTIWFTDKDGSSITDKCDFIVNREKRTVVALISVLGGSKPFRKGIAKCAPNDVFNAHIGRAIALRRALGLEVPAEYLSVPNPEEPRVGDVVAGGVVHAIRPTHRTVGKNAGFEFMCPNLGYTYITDEGVEWWAELKSARIIDDSREEVAE